MTSDPERHDMSDSCHDMADIGPRVGAWLRQAYPDCPAKRCSRDFKVSERQAQRWTAGERPKTEHLTAMAIRWGWRFLDFVFEGLAGPIPPVRVMKQEMDELDKRVARLEEERVSEDARVAAALSAVDDAGENSASGVESSRMVRPDASETDRVREVADRC